MTETLNKTGASVAFAAPRNAMSTHDRHPLIVAAGALVPLGQLITGVILVFSAVQTYPRFPFIATVPAIIGLGLILAAAMERIGPRKLD